LNYTSFKDTQGKATCTVRTQYLIEYFFHTQRDFEEDIRSEGAKLQYLFVELHYELTKYNENMLSESTWTGKVLSTLRKDYDIFKEWIQLLRANKRCIYSLRSFVK